MLEEQRTALGEKVAGLIIEEAKKHLEGVPEDKATALLEKLEREVKEGIEEETSQG